LKTSTFENGPPVFSVALPTRSLDHTLERERHLTDAVFVPLGSHASNAQRERERERETEKERSS
jgi:hypothetical protein